jgi:two-component system, response regulator
MSPMNDIEILLVEDNPCDAELTMRALKKRNLCSQLVWIKDGAAALALFFGQDGDLNNLGTPWPKVILLDLKLPKVDGLEVLRRLKSHPSTSALPVVVLTSSREEQDVVRSFALGANSYIVKPVDFDNFAEAVTHLGAYWLLLNQPPEPAKSHLA